MSWEFWINENEKQRTTVITEPVNATLDEIQSHIEARAKLLNGQLRGPINAKGREENLDLIIITMASLFEDGYKLGYEDGKFKTVTDKAQ